MIVPTQEVGDRARERQEERIVQGRTVKIAKIPREQDDLQGIVKKFNIFFEKNTLWRHMGAKLLPRDRTSTVGPEGKFLIRCVMCVTKTTGNESVIESSRNAEDTTRGANYSINH